MVAVILLAGAYTNGIAQEPATPAPAAPAAAPASPATPAAMQEMPVVRKSFLRFVFDASPVLFFIILAMSIYLVAVIIKGFLSFQVEILIPPALASSLDGMLKEKKYKEAYEALKGNPSVFANALKTGVENLSNGWDPAMDAMLTVVEDTKIQFEHKISPVAVFGQLGPMIGLFGTVVGMILAFMSISSGGQPKPAELAAEIAIALCATLEGLTLALPAIWFYAVLKNKVHRLIFDLETISESYLRRFAQAVKK